MAWSLAELLLLSGAVGAAVWAPHRPHPEICWAALPAAAFVMACELRRLWSDARSIRRLRRPVVHRIAMEDM
jgi:hypothetical protein